MTYTFSHAATTGQISADLAELRHAMPAGAVVGFPAAANSGQYRATDAARSRSPQPARMSAHSAVMVLVADQAQVIVARCHGVVRAASACPPQTDVHDRLAVQAGRCRGACVLAVQRRRERVTHGGEPVLARALDVGHARNASPAGPGRATRYSGPGGYAC